MTASHSPSKTVLLASAALVAGILSAAFFLQPSNNSDGPELIAGTYLPQPRLIPDFQLQDSKGQLFDKSRLMGQWSVIFVGFTHCPDICPNTLGLLKTVNKKLEAQDKKLQVVFLSVDPQRDTADILHRYVNYFDPSFVGATGDDAELERLGKGIGYVYMKSAGSSAENYSMDHSAALILINPHAQVAGYITPPLKLDELVADFSRIIPAGKSS